MTANPLLEDWQTPFGAPPFDRIASEHFLPAFTEAITQFRAEVEAVAANPDAPGFANTVEALEQAGRLLDQVNHVFGNLSSADTNEALQAAAREITPTLAALSDDVHLDPRLFSRIEAVWAAREPLALAPAERRLLDETRKRFVRSGARLDTAGKDRLRQINTELATLEVTFGDNLLHETNAYRLVIEKPEDLAGLPPAVVAAAADAAAEAGLAGTWVFTLHAPSLWPFLDHAASRERRRELFTAYTTRGDHGDAHDNNAAVARIAALRAERAALVGYATHAHFVLEDAMATTPARVHALLAQLWTPAVAMARREAADLQAMIHAEGGRFPLEPWDWRFYTEKVRKARYDVDDQALLPYFPLDRVREGAFYVAHRLFGLTFVPRPDLPVYHPEVEAFEVKDEDGSHLGVFYTDFHPRPGKRVGAWSNTFRNAHRLEGRDVRPIVVNVCNFPRPTSEAPALLSLEDVQTLFHEFGHALHSLLSRVPFASLGAVPRDFVELPSQILENWSLEPEVLRVYARHHRTGEPIPLDLVEKIKRMERFNQGFATVEYLAAAFLDMDWHLLTAGQQPEPADFERASLARIGLPREIVVRYRSPYFNHLFGAGLDYAASYYSYIWSEVLDADAFEAFKERGIFDPATARAFRRDILEPGGLDEAADLYRRFRGRDPDVRPLLLRRGLAAED